MATNVNPWIQIYRPDPGAELRLICFPYAGGGASVFRPWTAVLSPAIEVWAVQIPGRENRFGEPPLDRMAPLVDALVDALASNVDRPYAIFGHSVGGRIGFEVARRLQQSTGSSPAHLFVSSARAPHLPEDEPLLHTLSDGELIERLLDLGGATESILKNADLMELMLPVIRADVTLNETYEYMGRTALTCPISAFGGLEDGAVSMEDLEGWAVQTTGAFSIRRFPGGHFYLHSAQPLLLEAMQDALTIRRRSSAGRDFGSG